MDEIQKLNETSIANCEAINHATTLYWLNSITLILTATIVLIIIAMIYFIYPYVSIAKTYINQAEDIKSRFNNEYAPILAQYWQSLQENIPKLQKAIPVIESAVPQLQNVVSTIVPQLMFTMDRLNKIDVNAMNTSLSSLSKFDIDSMNASLERINRIDITQINKDMEQIRIATARLNASLDEIERRNAMMGSYNSSGDYSDGDGVYTSTTSSAQSSGDDLSQTSRGSLSDQSRGTPNTTGGLIGFL